MASPPRYRYIGPPELRDQPPPGGAVEVGSQDILQRWLADQDDRERTEPFTYVVDVHGSLWLAPRRSEHVACARGNEVLAAGEIQFEPDAGEWIVNEISNQSTGYCPNLNSWSAVEGALDRAGVGHPDNFTHPVVFRGCLVCFGINVVRDGDFVCAVCGSDLPSHWNLDKF
jgi:hypothetical protein